MLSYFKNHTGFTILELIISIAIVTVILTVVVLNQSTYTDGIAITNLADEISLTISQAQVYGVGVKEFSSGSSEFSASYGLSFSLLASGSNSAYIYFADRNGDGVYNGDWACPIGGTSECLEKGNISRGNYIDSLCAVVTSGPDQCVTPKRIDISFSRPNTKAQIIFFNSAGASFLVAGMKGAKIILKSPKGSTRSVTVYETGQISVQ